jgi:hypothetical protein
MQRERIFDHRRCANWGNSRHSGRSIAPLGRVSYAVQKCSALILWRNFSPASSHLGFA